MKIGIEALIGGKLDEVLPVSLKNPNADMVGWLNSTLGLEDDSKISQVKVFFTYGGVNLQIKTVGNLKEAEMEMRKPAPTPLPEKPADKIEEKSEGPVDINGNAVEFVKVSSTGLHAGELRLKNIVLPDSEGESNKEKYSFKSFVEFRQAVAEAVARINPELKDRRLNLTIFGRWTSSFDLNNEAIRELVEHDDVQGVVMAVLKSRSNNDSEATREYYFKERFERW